MKIALHDLAVILERRLGLPKLSEQQFSRQVAAYLLEEGRTGELDSLLRDMVRERAEHGTVEITAVSAFALSDAVLTKVRAQVKQVFPRAKTIIINQRRDPSVVGGVRLELVDRQLDLSIRHTLNRFKELTTSERTA